MKKTTILYIVSTLGRTGPTRQLLYLISRLDRSLFDPHVVTLSLEPADSLKPKFIKIGIKLHSLELSRFTGLFLALFRLKRFLKLLKPDIIHSQGLRADWLSSQLNNTIRIATQRNNPFSDYPSLMGQIPGWLAAHLHYRALRRLQVVACSESISQVNQRFALIDTIIRNGVDTTAFSPLVQSAITKYQRLELNLPVDGQLFIYTGPVINRKNIPYLIRTFAKKTSHNDYLVILGTGPLLEHLRKIAGDKPNIIFRGGVDNVPQYLQVADWLVSASLDEGLPNSVLEALATGVPALLSDIPPHREILALSPDSGELFDVNDPDSLCNLICMLARSADMRKNARALATNHFSCESMSARYQALYHQQLKAR